MFKLPKVKIDYNHIFNDLLFLGIAAGIGAILFKNMKYLGLFSYNGLSEAEIERVYKQFHHRFWKLSTVSGYNPLLGGYFERGIVTPRGHGAWPLYFHYSRDGHGGAEFEIYPMVDEVWTTEPGIGGIGQWFTGHLTYPTKAKIEQYHD